MYKCSFNSASVILSAYFMGLTSVFCEFKGSDTVFWEELQAMKNPVITIINFFILMDMTMELEILQNYENKTKIRGDIEIISAPLFNF